MKLSARLFARLPAVSAIALLGACATTGDMDTGDMDMTASDVAAEAQMAAQDAAQEPSFEPAPVSDLIASIDIPYETFTLDNGLTVVVHTDRKAPVVAVNVSYDIGSKHEPAGQTGFAHLFEHLMFNGSENAPGDFFEPLQDVGATDFNGTTNPDRTNYFETVPTGALDRALMLESDRMGYLLGAVDQERLDNQIGVVQNEKRQGDNQPYGLLRYEIFENLFPQGHPYHHSTIGSMDDLTAASLEDVQSWFRANYGPNNAVLVLAGDIDVATARPMVERWFGAIPRGPDVNHPEITIPTLAEDTTLVTTDQISTTRIWRMWTTPASGTRDSTMLDLGSSVLGGLFSSRLDNALVRDNPVAVSVGSFLYQLEDAGVFIVQADIRPGEDPARVGELLDEEIAAFLAGGPTEDELSRAKTTTAASLIRGLESVGGFGGKAPVLAEGQLFHDNPAFYRQQLEWMDAATPADVLATMNRWLTRPVFNLVMNPGERTAGGEDRGGAVVGDDLSLLGTEFYCNAAFCNPEQLQTQFFQQEADRSQLPPVGQLSDLDFPDVETTTLSNGMRVYFARRDAVPTVAVRVAFDAGYSSDNRATQGLHSLMLQAMDQGTITRDTNAFAEAQEALGASVGSWADSDWTYVQLSALTPNLAPSLELLADYVRNPAFRDADLERVRAQQLNRIESELRSPGAIAQRALAPIIYGADHPYGLPPSGLGEASVVAGASAAQLAQVHRTWFRPDNARVFVVGDTTLAETVAMLEASFADWVAPATPLPTKNFSAAIPAPEPRIVLIDRPNSPQSIITAGRVLDGFGTDDNTVLFGANEVFGGSFLSRINMNLRETKGWSYGVRSGVQADRDRIAFIITAPVQADRTGDSLTELRSDLTAYLGDSGVTDAELARMINGNTRELPGRFETSGDVLGGLVNMVKYDRPFDYYETLADAYRGFTTADVDAAARANFLDEELVFVIVGAADVVTPQLEGLGLPVELRMAAED